MSSKKTSLLKKSTVLLTTASLVIPAVGFAEGTQTSGAGSSRYSYVIDRFLDDQIKETVTDEDFSYQRQKTLLGASLLALTAAGSIKNSRKLEELKKVAEELEINKLPEINHQLAMAETDLKVAEAKAKIVVEHSVDPAAARANLGSRLVSEIEEIDSKLDKAYQAISSSEEMLKQATVNADEGSFKGISAKDRADVAKVFTRVKQNAEKVVRELESQKEKLAKDLVELQQTTGTGLPKSIVGEDGRGARTLIATAEEKSKLVANLTAQKAKVEEDITAAKKQLTSKASKSGRALGKSVRILGYVSGGFIVLDGTAALVIMYNLNKNPGQILTYHFLSQHHSEITDSLKRALEN